MQRVLQSSRRALSALGPSSRALMVSFLTPNRFSSSAAQPKGGDAAEAGKEKHHVATRPTTTEGASFIDKVKAGGASVMLGAFVSTGKRFDRTLDGMSVRHIGTGTVTCELTVHDGVQNAYATLHGGAIATIIDIVGTMALLTLDPTRAGVSVDMSTSFVSAAKAGEKVIIEGKVLKAGKRLGFTQVDIYKESDNSLIASGRHTKAL